MKTAFMYSDAYLDYDYGLTHPLKIIRLQLVYEPARISAHLDSGNNFLVGINLYYRSCC